jgi:hypothetical protein
MGMADLRILLEKARGNTKVDQLHLVGFKIDNDIARRYIFVNEIILM